MAALIGGYIPVPAFPTVQAGWDAGLLAVFTVLLLAIAIPVALVYFNRPKATPAAKEVPFELPKAA